MEESEQNNPAGRLHEILARAQEHASTSGVIGHAGVFWASVFDIPTQPRVPTVSGPALYEVISRLLQLEKLIKETEQALSRILGLPDRYFRPFGRIRTIPSQSLAALGTDITGAIRQITEGDMTVLEFCSEKLEQQHAERIVDKAELHQILEDVSALFDEVQQSDMEAELKTFILDGLESIRRGIYEFRIRGSERLKETVGEIVGSLYVNYKTVSEAGDDESLEKFNALFNRLTTMVTFANTSVKLLSAFATPLLPG